VTSTLDPSAPPHGSLRWLLLFVGAVAIALLVPFLVAAPAVDRWFAGFEADAVATVLTAAVVIGLLTVDVVAPVPSSLVAAFAGVTFGPIVGSLLVFVGLSIGCAVGYVIGRRVGRSVGGTRYGRRAGRRVLATAAAIHSRDAAIAVVVTRPVPLLAEATVVVAGLSGMRRTTFAFACLAANAVVAILFAGVPGTIA
jgi:uncharacterized membrane protein YdjX (TVP38/TMEM64 family)